VVIAPYLKRKQGSMHITLKVGVIWGKAYAQALKTLVLQLTVGP